MDPYNVSPPPFSIVHFYFFFYKILICDLSESVFSSIGWWWEVWKHIYVLALQHCSKELRKNRHFGLGTNCYWIGDRCNSESDWLKYLRTGCNFFGCNFSVGFLYLGFEGILNILSWNLPPICCWFYLHSWKVLVELAWWLSEVTVLLD